MPNIGKKAVPINIRILKAINQCIIRATTTCRIILSEVDTAGISFTMKLSLEEVTTYTGSEEQ